MSGRNTSLSFRTSCSVVGQLRNCFSLIIRIICCSLGRPIIVVSLQAALFAMVSLRELFHVSATVLASEHSCNVRAGFNNRETYRPFYVGVKVRILPPPISTAKYFPRLLAHIILNCRRNLLRESMLAMAFG